MADCKWYEVICKVGDAAGDMTSGAMKDGMDTLATLVIEGFGRVLAGLGSIWLFLPSNALTQGTSGALPDQPQTVTAPIEQLLGMISWYSLIITVISLTILGGMIAVKYRSGEAYLAVGRIGLVLAAAAVIGVAPSIVQLIIGLSYRPIAGSAVLWLQNSLMWVTFAIAMGGLMVSAARMAWQMRAEPGQAAMRDLMRLAIVIGASIPILFILMRAGDEFSKYFFLLSTSCDISVSGGACFGENVSKLLLFSSGLGAILLIIFGTIAIFASSGQILLMIARSAAVVLLAGFLGVAAAAAMTGQKGQQWWEKALAWLIAWLLYKPVAAVIYGTSFMLTGALVDGAEDIVTILVGLMMMIVALFALPALMRLVTPMVSAMASGAAAGGGFAGALAGSMLPSGAQALKNLLPSGNRSGTNDAPSGANQAPTGNTSSTTPPAGNQQPQQKPGQESTTGAATGTGTGTSSGNATGAATGSGTAAAGTGVGAAAGGPVGAGVVAAGAVADAAQQAGQQFKQFGEESMGEPSGNK